MPPAEPRKLENAHPNLEKYQTTSTSLCGIARQLRDAKFRKKVTEEACEQLYWGRDQSEKFKGATFEEVLDTHTHLIGLQNGVYDLKMHQFREGRCEDYITLNTMRDWKEFEWTDPIIDEIRTFLKQVIPNDSVREYVLYTLATFLDGEIVHEHFHIWIGSGGNGKSKLIELFEHAMGKYCAKLAVSALTQKRASSSAPTPEIVRLKGKRFVVLQEPNENEKIQVGIMKEMTGGDKIVARGLNKEPIEFKPQMKMVLIDSVRLKNVTDVSVRGGNVDCALLKYAVLVTKLFVLEVHQSQLSQLSQLTKLSQQSPTYAPKKI